MATSAEWATGFARQADADFKTFGTVQDLPIPACHRLLFLQMACEKLVKSHLYAQGRDPVHVQCIDSKKETSKHDGAINDTRGYHEVHSGAEGAAETDSIQSNL